MEAAGLGVGILGIAGLFGACLDIIEKVDSYNDFGVESDYLFARIEADRVRFRQWGQNVGIDQADHHDALDDPAVRSAVSNILKSIKNIDGGTEDNILTDYGKPGQIQGSGALPKRRMQFEDFQGETSRRSKVRWALRGKAKFLALVEAFDSLVQKLHDLVPTGQTTAVDQIGLGVRDGYYTSNFETQRALAELKKHVDSELRKQLDDWLDTCWTNKMYDNFVHRRLDDTCDWILNHAEFLRWKSLTSRHANMLWVNGPPGYGKTILCARIIEHLSITSKDPLAYFFFSSDLERRADPFVIMRSWISQIVKQSEQAFDLALERWEAADGRTASHTDIEELFKSIVQTIPGCTFIVDGLDECAGVDNDWKTDHRETLTGFLKSLRCAVLGEASLVLIVSRNTQEIRDGLTSGKMDKDSELAELQVLPEYVRADATLFSRNIVNQKLPNKSEEQREKLSNKMVDRCESMFLGIKMLEGDLSGGKNLKQLQRIIDQTPHGLEHIYDRNWERITSLRESSRCRAFSILRWAAFSLRPITVLEITEALLLADEDCDEPSYDELPDSIDDVYIKSEILDLCGSLVETRGTGSSLELDSLTIHLTHFSVRQYVLCHMLSSSGQLIVNERLRSFNEAVENNIIARTCLRYLDSQRVWEEYRSQETANPMAQAFRAYASNSWDKHVRSSVVNSEEVTRWINTFFRPGNERWELWRKGVDAASEDSMLDYEGEITSGNRLFYASLLGFLDTMKYLVEEVGLDVNSTDQSNRTALFAASSKGWVPGVSYLLQIGADVTVPSNKKRTPVHIAAYCGYINIVKLLFEKGADLMAADMEGFTPLHGASSENRIEVVDFLLEKNVDLTTTDDERWTPLYLASEHGHVEIVKRLLDRGANPMATIQQGATPLYAAAKRGHVETIKVLLEKGVDSMGTIYGGWSPLHLVSHYGYAQIVELLVKKGADPMLLNNRGRTPLYLACCGGHTETVRLLLNITDRSIQCDNGRTLLLATSCYGRLEIARLLLEHGADLTVPDNGGWTPLATACANGYTEMVKLFLEHGADLTVTENDGWTPLNLASYYGHTEIVELLLEQGAIASGFQEGTWTPIRLASFEGHIETVKLLLLGRTSLEVSSDDKEAALLDASSEGHTEIVKLLLANGVDPTVLEDAKNTPLQDTSNDGHTRAVKRLVETAADLIVQDDIEIIQLHGALDHDDIKGDKEVDSTTLSNRSETLNLISHKGHMEIGSFLCKKAVVL